MSIASWALSVIGPSILPVLPGPGLPGRVGTTGGYLSTCQRPRRPYSPIGARSGRGAARWRGTSGVERRRTIEAIVECGAGRIDPAHPVHSRTRRGRRRAQVDALDRLPVGMPGRHGSEDRLVGGDRTSADVPAPVVGVVPRPRPARRSSKGGRGGGRPRPRPRPPLTQYCPDGGCQRRTGRRADVVAEAGLRALLSAATAYRPVSSPTTWTASPGRARVTTAARPVGARADHRRRSRSLEVQPGIWRSSEDAEERIGQPAPILPSARSGRCSQPGQGCRTATEQRNADEMSRAGC
jgi:hypothetical protein